MIPRRLDKFLADATDLSRSQIEDAFYNGRVEVICGAEPWVDDYEPWSLIFEDDRVLLDGEPVTPSPPRHYIALHKPAGIICTTDHPEGRDCLKPWMDRLPDALFPVGRLDKPTTGLLLLTDDGDLCFCLLRPWFHVEKEYHLTVRGTVDTDDPRLKLLEEGVDIGDNKPPPTALRTDVVDRSDDTTVLSVVVHEGRHRMVRRMARGVGLDLQHLHRPRIGPVQLGDVAPGDHRRLTDDEVNELWEACGTRQASKQRQIDALRRQAEKWRRQNRPHHRLHRWLEAHAS